MSGVFQNQEGQQGWSRMSEGRGKEMKWERWAGPDQVGLVCSGRTLDFECDRRQWDRVGTEEGRDLDCVRIDWSGGQMGRQGDP